MWTAPGRAAAWALWLSWAVFAFARAGAAYAQESAQSPAAASPPAVVWTAFHPDTGERFGFENGEVRRMTDRLVCAVTGTARPADAWRALVSENARVGIRVSASGGPYLRTHPAIVAAVVNGLEAAGHPRSRIVIWDRDEKRVRAAGYGDAAPGCRLAGVYPGLGFDPEAQLSAPLLGKLIWGDLSFVPTPGAKPDEEGPKKYSSVSHLSTVLSKQVDVVINLPVATSGVGAGMEGGIAQMVLANIDNWRRLVGRSGAYGDPYLAEAYADERVGGKVVLTIMDALVGQYAGGPEFDPNYTAGYRMLLSSRDPVAVDAVAMRMLDVRRKDAALPPLEKISAYLETASAIGLGQFGEAAIRVDRVAGMEP